MVPPRFQPFSLLPWLRTFCPGQRGEPAAEAAENPADHAGTVKSPMVGTVYTAQNQTHPLYH